MESWLDTLAFLWLGRVADVEIPAAMKAMASFLTHDGEKAGKLFIGVPSDNDSAFKLAGSSASVFYGGDFTVLPFESVDGFSASVDTLATTTDHGRFMAWWNPEYAVDAAQCEGGLHELYGALVDTGANVARWSTVLEGRTPCGEIDGFDRICSLDRYGNAVEHGGIVDLDTGNMPLVLPVSLFGRLNWIDVKPQGVACGLLSYMYDKESGYGSDGGAIAKSGESHDYRPCGSRGVSAVICELVEGVRAAGD